MPDTDLAIKEENALAEFDFGGLYQNVEQNYKPSFNPWRVKLLQKTSPEVDLAEIGGIEPRPGMFLVGPMDGTGRDRLFSEIHVVLIDYYSGRIMNELGDDGKPVGGTNSKRVCGSMDGVRPFFPMDVVGACEEAGEPVHVALMDWRQPELGVVTITEDSVCEGCPMSSMKIKDEDGKWLPPPCGDYHRIIMFCLEVMQPIQWQAGSFNVLKPLEGRKRVKRGNPPIPGLRKMSYPSNPGEIPPFIRDGKPYSIKVGSDIIQTIHQPIRVPVLSYSDNPMTADQWAGFRKLEKFYSEQKAAFLETIINDTAPDRREDSEPVASDPAEKREVNQNVKDALGAGGGRKKRRLGAEDEEETL